jgi:hypothetical protein
MKGASDSSRIRNLDRWDASKDVSGVAVEDETISRITAAVL